jgi:hypothetical protein
MSIKITLPADCYVFSKEDYADISDAFITKPGGVYVFRDSAGNCLYVGKTVDFRKRLQTHFKNSPFADEIDTVTVYYCSDPAERDIYETHAINDFNAKYNRDKVSTLQRPFRSDIELIEDCTDELRELKIREQDIIHSINELDTIYGKPGRKRTVNNFTGELSQGFYENMDALEHFRANRESDYQDEKEELLYELRQIEEEVEEVTNKLTKLKRKIRV